MKQNIDELINKYVDNELTVKELEEFNELVDGDEEIMRKVKAHKLVHAYLNQTEFDSAPTLTTQSIMLKINQSLSGKLEKNYFFFGTLGVLTILLIGSIIFFFTYFGKSETKYTGTESLITTISGYINSFFANVSSKFVDANVMLIISTITLILMLGIYFIFESRKSFKKKLHSLS